MRFYLYIILSLLFLSSCGNKEETIPRFEVKPEVPEQILEDHQYFLERLKPINSYKNSTGIAAG